MKTPPEVFVSVPWLLRLLHFKPLFQQVHSLHHRNTDIEPFAGLCMHPVEHL